MKEKADVKLYMDLYRIHLSRSGPWLVWQPERDENVSREECSDSQDQANNSLYLVTYQLAINRGRHQRERCKRVLCHMW